MMKADYIEPGRYADPNGHEIVVAGPTPDGRYEVEYPMSGHHNILSSKTIRSLYPIVAAVLALALLPTVALGASEVGRPATIAAPKHLGPATALAKARARADLRPLYAQNAQLTPMKVACGGPASHITCTGTATSVADGGHWTAIEVLAVKHGKVRVVTPAYQPTA